MVQALEEATVAATCRISYVECCAAFARATREGRLAGGDQARAVRNLDDRWSAMAVLEVNESLARDAAALLSEHPLRAADAVHLAAGTVLASGSPGGSRFACWDRRLWEAAALLGFRMVPESLPPPP